MTNIKIANMKKYNIIIVYFSPPYVTVVPEHSHDIQLFQVINISAEMEKRADGADASVLFFLLGCANFLAVYVQIR